MSTTVQTRLDVALRSAREEQAPNAAGAIANVMTFGWRALLKIKHMPEQLFDVVVTPIMFTVLFTFLFGGALAGSTRSYLHFLLPGILVQTVMFSSVYTGFTLNTDIGRGVFDRFRSMPIWKPAPIVGAMAADTVRYTISSLIVVLVGVIMGYRPDAGIAGILLSILLLDYFAFGIGWVFMTVALAVRTASTVLTMSWLVLMPLTFASNIYVNPATMPGWLQSFVAVNPVALLVTALRGVLAEQPDITDIGVALIAPTVITAICAPIAMSLYNRKH